MFIEVVNNGKRVLVNLDRVVMVRLIGSTTYIEFGSPEDEPFPVEESFETIRALIQNAKYGP